MFRSFVKLVLSALFLVFMAPTKEAYAQRVLTVNSTGDFPDASPIGAVCDTGQNNAEGAVECTLRAAIEEANVSALVDTIRFDIPSLDTGCPGGICTISPLTVLPSVTKAVVIEGTSQPGATCGSDFAGRDLKIVLDGTSQTSGVGLWLPASSSVSGLVVVNFPSTGIVADGGGTALTCNIIGADPTGTTTLGNVSQGIWLATGSGSRVGTDGNGTDDDQEGNLISGNFGNGIRVEGGSNHVIAGNLIGVQMDGVSSLPNTNFGVFHYQSSNTVTGGNLVREWNTVAHNGNVGVGISASAGTGNRVQQNRMFSNGGLGIDINTDGVTANDPTDIDGGVNNTQNYPAIVAATIQNSQFHLNFYVDSDTSNAAYPLTVEFYFADADQEEGERIIAQTSYSETDWHGCGSPPCVKHIFQSAGVLAPGDWTVATATDANGNTSEFSAPIEFVMPTGFVVNSTADSADATPGDGVCYTGRKNAEGNLQCTLRAAIEEANAIALADTVSFDIPSADPGCSGGICTIQPDSALPAITRQILIDGETQPGATCGSGFSTRVLNVVLDGTNAGAANGLTLSSTSNLSTIRGLVIHSFGADGIELNESSVTWIACNYIGTDVTGMTDLGNAEHGIQMVGANPNVIVGTNGDGVSDGGEGNLISGNGGSGISVSSGSNDIRVSGNYIGLNAAGTATLGNTSLGFSMNGVNGLIFGTNGDGVSDDLEANVVVGNLRGVVLNHGANNRVAGNFIGTDSSGTKALGNLNEGLFIVNTANTSFVGTDLDGSPGDAQEGNVIAFNGTDGVDIRDTAKRIAVLGNSIYSNGHIGIDLGNNGATANDTGDTDPGQNNLQNYPVVSVAEVDGADLSITYTVDSDTANSDYPLTVEFFLADLDHHEGKTFVARDTFSVADWSTCGSVPCNKTTMFAAAGVVIGDTLVATATDSLGNTSEFSMPVEAVEAPPPPEGIALYVKAFLEGPFAGGLMATDLNDNGYLPLSQPFSDVDFDGTVLDYDSTQTVGALPDSAVDWVLVSLRTDSGQETEVAGSQFAALIFENGTVTSTGEDSLRFPGIGDGSYYLVVRGRNHADVMSSSAVDANDGTGSWDFTTASAQAFGVNPMRSLGGGVWGLYAADGNADKFVTAPDFNIWNSATTAGATGYEPSDYNMDGFVTAPDFNLWNANTTAGAASGVPD